MFANLKNKIFDEVKASPAKFQQFAQAAQAAVSSASSTTESVSGSDNFFSITEEDTPQNSPLKKFNNDKNNANEAVVDLQNSESPNLSLNNGIPINRTRRLSNSSMASDISFRLPAYDAPAVYHLQSDLDTASEYEESVSSASRLDVITKEQLHDAYKKSLDRYQKYRSRYTDLAKRYRDLERDSSKARSVLVETQDKAIRRISELREQCTLEQQAKAHLEEALRMEMDDMQCKIKAYQTKLKLIGQNPENILNSTQNEQNSSIGDDSLIKLDSDDSRNLINLSLDQNVSENSKNNSSNSIDLNKKIQKLEETLLLKCDEILKLNEKLNASEKTIETLKKREEENSIILAQNKLEIHSELENKESAMKKLKSKITELENKLQQSEKEKSQFKTQSTQMTELKEKLKQITETKQDFEAKIISHDHIIGELKKKQSDKDKVLETTKKTAEEQIKNLTVEFERKLNDLKIQNDELNAICERNNNQEIDLAKIDNDLNLIKTENNMMKENLNKINSEKIELQKKLEDYQKQLNQSLEQIEINQNSENDMKRENQESKTKINELTKTLKEMLNDKEINENKIKQLDDELLILRKQNEETDSETIIALKETLQKNQNELNEQIKSLQDIILSKDTEFKSLINQFEKIKLEHENVKSQKSNEKEKYDNNCKSLKEKLKVAENKIVEIKKEREKYEEKMEMEKAELTSQVTNILQEINNIEEQLKDVKSSHSQLDQEKRNLESKIENMQQQNQEGQEGNERIQEQLKNAEMKLRQVEVKLQSVESENSQLAEKNCLLEENSNRLEKLITENETLLKKEKANLNETIQNSELNLSGLRMKCETATENERKLNEKISQVLDENSRLHNAKELMEHEFRSLQDQCEEREKEKLCVLDSNKCLEEEMKKMRTENEQLNENKTKIENDLTTLTGKRQTEKEKREKLQNELKSVQKSKENLEVELKILQNRINETSQNGNTISNMQEENTKLKETSAQHDEVCKNLKQQLTSLNQQFVDDVNKLEKSYKEKIDTAESEMNALRDKLNGLGKENTALREQNDSFKKELDTLNNQNQARLAELENLLKETNDHNQTLQQSVLNATDLEKKLQNYEQLKIENEYLNTLTNQLESDMRKQKEDKQKSEEEINQMKIKMKSQQCELYVLSENKDKHEVEIAVKLAEIDKLEKEVKKLNETLEEERANIKQQMDHSKFISQQNDTIQSELLLYQTKLQEAEKLCGETRQSYEQVINENIQLQTQIEYIQTSNTNEIEKLKEETEESRNSINDLTKDLNTAKILIEQLKSIENENDEYKNRIKELEIELAEKIETIENIERKNSEELAAVNKTAQHTTDMENLRKINERLQNELENLKFKSTTEISNLQQEIDDLTNNSKHLTEQVTNFELLKEQAAHLQNELIALKIQESKTDNNYNNNNNNNNENDISIREERDDLKNKLDKIMHEVQDVSNRNLFLEQQCENYLILEQSNERLKLANQKLSRQLDETLVSMQHSNEGIQANTEFEYLKNIMFQYLTGTVTGNNETLVKVIAAVLKFSPQQTQVAMEKEHQKHSLLGQINNLL